MDHNTHFACELKEGRILCICRPAQLRSDIAVEKTFLCVDDNVCIDFGRVVMADFLREDNAPVMAMRAPPHHR